MVRRRDICEAVRGLRPESEPEFRRIIGTTERVTIHLWDKDSIRYFVRFRTMPNPLFTLQPLTISGNAPLRTHYFLGELHATLLRNKDVEYRTGFVVTKAFPSDSVAQIWIVLDPATEGVRNDLPRRRNRLLHGQKVSCIQLSLTERAGVVKFEAVYNSGLLFWPLEYNSVTSDSINKDSMEQAYFHYLYHTKGLMWLLSSRTRMEREAILADHLKPGEISAFLDRHEKGERNPGQWMQDFRQINIIEKVRSIDLASTNTELRQVRELISSRSQESLNLQIRCPDGQVSTYTFRWSHNPRLCLGVSDDDGKSATDVRVQALQRDGDLSAYERYYLPRGTVVTIMTEPSKRVLCMPLGHLSGDETTHSSFVLVRFLGRNYFGVVFDYMNIDREDIVDPWNTVWAPPKRTGNFPLTDTSVSIGVLRDLFVDEVATLEQIEANGYSIHDASRVDGMIQDIA